MHATKAARGTPPTRETFTGFCHGSMIPGGSRGCPDAGRASGRAGLPLSLFNKNITDNDNNPLDGFWSNRNMLP